MRRFAAVVVVTLLTAGVALVGAVPPAAASTLPIVKVKPNQTVTIHGTVSPVTGVGTAYGYVNGYSIADCADAGNAFAWCDYYPIRLVDAKGKELSDKELSSNLYALAFTLTWNGDHIDAPPLGSFATSQLQMTIWNDPPKPKGETIPCDPAGNILDFYLCSVAGLKISAPNGDDRAYYDSNAFGSPPPLDFGLADPKRNSFAVLIANDLSTTLKYTLTIQLVETSANLSDLSIDIPPDLSSVVPLPKIAAPAFGTPLPAVNGATVTLNAADIGADADLDNLHATGDNLDLNDTGNVLRANAAKPLPKPGKASPLLMAIWLVVLPLVLFGGAALALLRRRSSSLGF